MSADGVSALSQTAAEMRARAEYALQTFGERGNGLVTDLARDVIALLGVVACEVDVRAYCPFAKQWLLPDEWLASQLREARRRSGLRFALSNMWLWLRGKPTLVHAHHMRDGALLVRQSMHQADDDQHLRTHGWSR
jgi:hypothetical protein